MSNRKIILSDLNWKFRRAGSKKWYPAKVPGCVHTDLFRNGLISDPFFGLNEKDLQWIEKEDWEYRLEFTIEEDPEKGAHYELCFKGLDTYACVRLNNKEILKADNMFIPWPVNISDQLRKGNNQLHIILYSPYNTALKEYKKLPYQLPANNDEGEVRTSPFTRKAPYMYGWDWGPRLLTSGIWKEVILTINSSARIRGINCNNIEVSEKFAVIEIEYELEVFKEGPYAFSIQIGENEKKLHFHSDKKLIRSTERIEIEEPELWWPRGYGEPHRYRIFCELKDDVRIIDSCEHFIGLRTAELINLPDENGSSFHFRINGKNIFIRGANIIPLEYFPSEITDRHYDDLILNALSVNMNMIRAWGGGIYEDDHFYELCDENGILVWQDFMFSCGMYPSDDNFLSNVEKEVSFQVNRLKKYSSIVLWCGNNEILEGYLGWGWKESLGKYHPEAFNSYKKLFHEMIPAILERNDPSRPYWVTSPSPGLVNEPNLREGDFHYWDLVKQVQPYTVYRENTGRFMSEFGFKSYPEIASIRKFLKNEDWDIHSEALEEHQGWETGAELVEKNINWFYPNPLNFQQFLYISQLLQADAITYAIKSYRIAKPFCMGSLYWQLNDCWPAASWSSIDYYGKWKALHYRLKNAYSDVQLFAEVVDDTLKIHAVSDLPETKRLRINLKIVDFEGNHIVEDNFMKDLLLDKAMVIYKQCVQEFLSQKQINSSVLIMKVFEGDHLLFHDLHFFTLPKKLDLKDPAISIHLERKFNKYFLFIKASYLAKGLYLANSKTEGFFSDNYFDLLPHEDKIVVFEPDSQVNCNLEDFRYISLWNCMV